MMPENQPAVVQEASARLEQENARLRRELARIEGVVLPHARRQENANGFQRGWHAALSRISEGDAWRDLAALVPEPAAEVEAPVCEAETQRHALTEGLRDLSEYVTERSSAGYASQHRAERTLLVVRARLEALLASSLAGTPKE